MAATIVAPSNILSSAPDASRAGSSGGRRVPEFGSLGVLREEDL